MSGMERISVLVRHGQSEWNLQNLFTGWQDPPLTELGRSEAREAGRRLEGERDPRRDRAGADRRCGRGQPPVADELERRTRERRRGGDDPDGEDDLECSLERHALHRKTAAQVRRSRTRPTASEMTANVIARNAA